MSKGYLLLKRASHQIDDIYVYTRAQWGALQADTYIKGLFKRFDGIVSQQVISKSIPSKLGVSGFYCRHEYHYIYWHYLPNQTVGIVAVLHQRMHQTDRLHGEFDA